jgi:glutathione-regulated potassium-efflux system ancillary protein KefC/glutathione-regulated potassium-efflux system protein KefB
VLYLVARAMRRARADSALVALALAQGGEFAFVLFAFAQEARVLTPEIAAPLIAAVALSMAATPLLLIAGERVSGLFARPEARAAPENLPIGKPHALIAGFGRFGQVVHRLLTANGFTTSILEHNADQVELVRTFRNKANYGDASRVDLLRAAGAQDAKLLVIAVDDPDKTLQIAEQAKRHFPHLKVLARAYDRLHVYELLKRDVHACERETFEGALRLGAAALRALGRRAHAAERAAGVFRRHDLRQLHEMAEHWGKGDFEAYRSNVNARRDMLEEALQRDLAAHGAIAPDAAWDSGDREELDQRA